MARYDCPHCRNPVDVPDEWPDAACPHCHNVFAVGRPAAGSIEHGHSFRNPVKTGFGAGFGWAAGQAAFRALAAAVVVAMVGLLLLVASCVGTPPPTRPAPAPRSDVARPSGYRPEAQEKRIYLEARRLMAEDPADTVVAAFMARHSVIPRELDRILETGDKARWPGHDLKK